MLRALIRFPWDGRFWLFLAAVEKLFIQRAHTELKFCRLVGLRSQSIFLQYISFISDIFSISKVSVTFGRFIDLQCWRFIHRNLTVFISDVAKMNSRSFLVYILISRIWQLSWLSGRVIQLVKICKFWIFYIGIISKL